jgi:membrane protein
MVSIKVPKRLKQIFELLKEIYSEWSQDKATRLAAAMSYYTIFSLPPLLLLLIAIAGFFLGPKHVQSEILSQVQGIVGPQGSDIIQTMLNQVSNTRSGIIWTVVGVVTLLMGAGGLFGQIRGALNTVWEVAPAPGRGIMTTVMNRLLSYSMVLGAGLILLLSLVLSAALSGLVQYFGNFLPASATLLQVANQIFSFAVIAVVFALIFKILPDVEISWEDVWVGAAFTALLFTIGKYVIGLYLGRSSTSSVYGAAGSLVVLLLWIYYSAQIFLLGAEFTQVWARKFGTRMAPKEDAVRIDLQRVTKAEAALSKRLSAARQAPPKPAPIFRPVSPQETQASERPPSASAKPSVGIGLSKVILYALAAVGFLIGLILGGIVGAEPDSGSSG